MANTYTKIYIHAVFAVKYRQSLIPPSYASDLHSYMAGIITAEGQVPLRINGMPDHVHLAIRMRPDLSISDLMRVVKANSSKWMNQQKWMTGRFSWQRGFGAFSYNESQVPNLIRYIDRQQIHHSRQSFKKEYIELLEAFQVDYEPDYLFDWVGDY